METAEPVQAKLGHVAFQPRPARYSSVYLLCFLTVLFVLVPFLEDLPGGDLIETLALSSVMVCSVLAVGGRRRSLSAAFVLMVPALGGKWAHHLFPGSFSALFYLLASLAFFGFVVTHLVGGVLRASRVDANVLCAGLSGYLLLGLLWIPAYLVVARLNPAAFNLPSNTPAGGGLDRFTAFYFSFITLCTVGYGDVTPVSKVARMLAITEAIAGLFYVAVLISRLVGIYSSPRLAPSPDIDSSAKQEIDKALSE